VTFLLIAVCVCVFSLTQHASNQAQAAAERELQGAIAYFLEHPYLEPGAILSQRVDMDKIEQTRKRQRFDRSRRGAPPIPKRVQERQQEQLDQLVQDAFTGLADLPSQRWGFRATEFAPLTLVTHVILHQRSLHLMGALFLLLILGFQLENAWGSLPFALFFLLSSAASATAYAIGNSGFAPPLIGLSGVLAALLAAFLIQGRSTWKEQPVYLFALVLGALFLILPVRSGNDWSVATGLESTAVLAENQGASYWALGGGFLFGLLGQLIIGLFSTGGSEAVPKARKAAERIANPMLERAMNAQSAGKLNEAYGTLAELLRRNPDDHEALLLMWDVGLDYSRPADAAAAMLRAIRDEVKRGDAAAAVEHWLDLVNRGLHADAEPALLIRLALMLEQQAHSFAAVEALRQALQRTEDSNAAVVASRVARASRDLDPDTARAAAWRALGSADLDLEERQSLESLLAEIGPGIDMDLPGSAGDGRAVDIEFEQEEAIGAAEVVAREEPEAWVDPALVDESAGSDAGVAAKMETVELEDVVRVGDRPTTADGTGYNRPAPIDLDVVSRTIRSVDAIPVALEAEGLLVELDRGAKKRIPPEKLEAISVAAVGGLSENPVILIDLVTNWKSAADEPLRVVRIRGDRFDARALSGGRGAPLDALRAFVGRLLRASGAKPLPDEQSANGLPFASYDDLTSYQRHVLGVEEEDPASG